MTVVGIDACRRGWFCIALSENAPPVGRFLASLTAVTDAFPEVKVCGVDIPIGLGSSDRRRADVEARLQLGRRASSLFFMPIRDALNAPSHREASEVSRQLTGKGISQQAYALVPKIKEAESFVRSALIDVREVHPEVSFAKLIGQPAEHSKKTWAGLEERRRALAGHGIVLDDLSGDTELAAPDDVLDAAVAAWSARRVLEGRAISIPGEPERDPETGRAVAIWV